ncbi:hypothetical protein [Chishuiella sp.]|uniref:hypothetical protein n=1 Tax=Chishuiella sp. TaxID=1969467 RepID=UPI0028A63210|nr:hypothetical protein [Chishuiella sp.]
MSKVTITKKLVEENSQLAQLLAEKNIAVGSKIEQSELDDLYKILETTELYELTQEDFDKEPGLTEKGFEVGQVIRVKKKEQAGEVNTSNVEENPQKGIDIPLLKPSYVVISRFVDKHNKSKIFETGETVPADFDEDRITDLLERKLIELA